jgi:hypothetical protein
MKNTETGYMIEKGDIVREFDCHVLSIDFKGGGGFATVFPVSDKAYRDTRKAQGKATPNKVIIEDDGEFTTFLITDDWNTTFEVSIDNCHYPAIQRAIDKAKEDGLLA